MRILLHKYFIGVDEVVGEVYVVGVARPITANTATAATTITIATTTTIVATTRVDIDIAKNVAGIDVVIAIVVDIDIDSSIDTIAIDTTSPRTILRRLLLLRLPRPLLLLLR